MILDHESFEDIVAIVKCAPQRTRPNIAAHVIEYLSTLFTRELSSRLRKLQLIQTQRTARFFRTKVNTYRPRIRWLRSHIAGLNSHKTGLCDFLSFRAIDFCDGGHWTWEVGNEIPKWPKKPCQMLELKDLLVIPQVCSSRLSFILMAEENSRNISVR